MQNIKKYFSYNSKKIEETHFLFRINYNFEFVIGILSHNLHSTFTFMCNAHCTSQKEMRYTRILLFSEK